MACGSAGRGIRVVTVHRPWLPILVGAALLALVAPLLAVVTAAAPSAGQATPSSTACGVVAGDPQRAEGGALDAAEQAMADAVNQVRQAQGLTTLQRSPTLQTIARWKAGQVAQDGPRTSTVADQYDPDGSWEARFLACGYPADAGFGEVLVGSTAPSDAVLTLLLATPATRAVLTNPLWLSLGVSRAAAGQVDGAPYAIWLLTFGTSER